MKGSQGLASLFLEFLKSTNYPKSSSVELLPIQYHTVTECCLTFFDSVPILAQPDTAILSDDRHGTCGSVGIRGSAESQQTHCGILLGFGTYHLQSHTNV